MTISGVAARAKRKAVWRARRGGKKDQKREKQVMGGKERRNEAEKRNGKERPGMWRRDGSECVNPTC